jgi:hypothetical protein
MLHRVVIRWSLRLTAFLAAAQGCARAQTDQLNPSREAWTARVEAARGANAAFAEEARRDTLARAAARRAEPPIPQGRIEDFIGDDTLRRGDVVVTDKGFRVFNGDGASPTTAEHFVPIDDARLRAERKTALQALERASPPNDPTAR